MSGSIDTDYGYYRTLSSFVNSHLVKRIFVNEKVTTQLEYGHYIVVSGSIKVEYVDLEKQRRSAFYEKNEHFYVDPRIEYSLITDKSTELIFTQISGNNWN